MIGWLIWFLCILIHILSRKEKKNCEASSNHDIFIHKFLKCKLFESRIQFYVTRLQNLNYKFYLLYKFYDTFTR